MWFKERFNRIFAATAMDICPKCNRQPLKIILTYTYWQTLYTWSVMFIIHMNFQLYCYNFNIRSLTKGISREVFRTTGTSNWLFVITNVYVCALYSTAFILPCVMWWCATAVDWGHCIITRATGSLAPHCFALNIFGIQKYYEKRLSFNYSIKNIAIDNIMALRDTGVFVWL